MLSFHNRRERVQAPQSHAGLIQIPGLGAGSQQPTTGPLPFAVQAASSSGALVAPGVTQTPSPTTGALTPSPITPVSMQGLVSGALLPLDPPSTGGLRQPVVIRGQRKKVAASPKPGLSAKKRRWLGYTMVLGAILFAFIASIVFVFPEGSGAAQHGFNPFQPAADFFRSSSSSNQSSANIYSTHAYAPPPLGPMSFPADAGPDTFPFGQCTFWADYRYHQLTGYWVTWSGNAEDWYAGALASGWYTSTEPHVPSIIVLMPGVQQASYIGHVAVVEGFTNDGGVYTSNMNWNADGGGPGIVTIHIFYPGPGVYFVWK